MAAPAWRGGILAPLLALSSFGRADAARLGLELGNRQPAPVSAEWRSEVMTERRADWPGSGEMSAATCPATPAARSDRRKSLLQGRSKVGHARGRLLAC